MVRIWAGPSHKEEMLELWGEAIWSWPLLNLHERTAIHEAGHATAAITFGRRGVPCCEVLAQYLLRAFDDGFHCSAF
jgi:hypothetical protein